MKSLKLLLFGLCMLFAANAFAQAGGTVTIKGDDGNSVITVAPGEEFNLVFYLTTEYSGFSPNFIAYLNMPEGIEITDIPVAEERLMGEDADCGFNKKSLTMFSVYSQWSGKRDRVSTGSGPILKVPCKATTAIAQDDPYVVNVTEISLLDRDGTKDDYYFADFDVNIYVKEAAATETVTITLDHEYITYCSDKPLDFSDSELGLTPLVVTNVTATEAEVAGLDKVAAYEGIIINGTPGTYTIPVVTGSTPSKYSGNKLVGTTEEISIDAGNYVLSDGKFLPCNEGTLPANKAYLPQDAVPTSAGAKGITIVFDGNTTGINEIQKAETDGAIYNLSGMRVSKTQKGVYIMNGRKVIVK